VTEIHRRKAEMWKSYSGNGVDGGRRNVTELRELNRDTARAPAIKATEFHCIKIVARRGGTDRGRFTKKTIMKEEEEGSLGL
jgi:hypothetical protein